MSKKSSQKSAKWFYRLGAEDYKIADFFILFAIVKNRLKAVYALPKILSPKTYITITKLNGNVRYDYFKTDVNSLGEKILKLQADLPRLIKIYKEEKSQKGE